MKTALVFLATALFSVSSTAAQNLLQDPSFEASTHNSQTNPFWTLDVNFPDGAGPAAQFQDAPWASNPAGTDGIGVWFRAFEGNQANGGDPLANATLYQDVSSPAGEYELSFYYRSEQNYTAETTLVELLEDGTQIGQVDLTNADTGGAWEQFSLTGSTAGGTLRVQAKMVNGQDAMANPQSAMLDDFDLTVVPEPSSMLLAVFGMVILAFRSRKPVATNWHR